MTRSLANRLVLSGAAAALLAGCAHTQTRTEPPNRKAPPPSSAKYDETRKQAAEIGSQPARDVGLLKRKVPPVLEDALTQLRMEPNEETRDDT